MNRKKLFLLTILVLVLAVSILASFVSCKRETGPAGGNTDEDVIITNGSFASVNSETFPKVPSGWTASAGSTSSSSASATPSTQGEDLISGVIDTKANVFRNNASKWKVNRQKNPFTPNNDDATDTNVLMINNLVSTAYKYTSSNVTLVKNSYYKITVDVRTEDDALAFIYVLGDAFAEFTNISTNSQWTTYEIYVETAKTANKSIQVVVSNGWGAKDTGTMSKGVVYFDNVKVEKLVEKDKEDDNSYGKGIYNEKVAIDNNGDRLATYSMLIPDGEFNYTSGSTMPYTPSKFRGYAGTSSDGSNSAPTGSNYVVSGVLDTTRQYDELSDIVPCPNTLGNKMLFINNKDYTAYGYKSSVSMLIEAGKEYTFSVWLRTVDVTGYGSDNNGAVLKLTKSTSDENPFEIKNINTNGEWKEFTFDIKANQLADTEVYVELWLGEGGSNAKDQSWAKGTVFMDKLSLKETSSTPAPLSEDGNKATADYRDSLDSEKNLLKYGYFMEGNTWGELAFDEDNYNFKNSGKAGHNVVKNSSDNDVPLPAYNLGIKTATGETLLDNALKMSITSATAYGIKIDNAGKNFNIVENGYYKLSMWVKTDLDEKYDSKGLNVKLKKVAKPISSEEPVDTEVASFTNINTRELETNNGYVQLIFYIEGNTLASEELYLEIMLGSGSRFTPQSHVVGDAYITLISMEGITYKDYSSANTSSYIKKNSLTTSSSSSESVSNGNFSTTDVNTTFENYKSHQGTDEGFEDNEIQNVDGKFILPTAPSNWTISNKSYLEALNTGIVANETQYNSIENKFNGMTYDEFANGIDGGALVISTKNRKGSNGFLTVATTPATCGCTCEKCIENGSCDSKSCDDDCNCLHKSSADGILPVGYTSQSISLSASSYYIIGVKVFAAEGSIAYVNLTNSSDTKTIKVNGDNARGWTKVYFYVETGLSSTSAKLELYLGDKTGDSENKERITGTVAFDNAFYYQIDEEAYDNEIAELSDYKATASYTTDSFNIDNPSEDSLTSPSNWTGSSVSGGKTDSDSLTKGVFDKNYSRREWLKTVTDDNTNYIDETVWNYLVGENTDNNVLVINNIIKNGYSYTNSSDSKTLAKDSYYKVSVSVLTYGLSESEYAYISLKLNNVTYTFGKDADNNVLVNTSKYVNGSETLGVWTTYTFFVKTPAKASVSNVTITLGLGEKSSSSDEDKKEENFVQGYAFFDNVAFETSTKEEFEKSSDGSNSKKITFTDEDAYKEAPKEEDENNNESGSLLWLYISSGVIGALIIIVVIAFLIKKYWYKIAPLFKKNKGTTLGDYDKNHPSNQNNVQKPSQKNGKNNKKSSDNYND